MVLFPSVKPLKCWPPSVSELDVIFSITSAMVCCCCYLSYGLLQTGKVGTINSMSQVHERGAECSVWSTAWRGKKPSFLKNCNILYIVSIMPQYQVDARCYLIFSSSCCLKDPDSTCYLTPKAVSFMWCADVYFYTQSTGVLLHVAKVKGVLNLWRYPNFTKLCVDLWTLLMNIWPDSLNIKSK